MTALKTDELSIAYHLNLPQRIRSYLNTRGISDEAIDKFVLGWNGNRITIPIFRRDGQLAFFKLAKDPEDSSPGPKMLMPAGATAELYGWEHVLYSPDQIIICEGEFDRLVLENLGFAAVTSTGGAGTFRREWADALREIPAVYVCFDNDPPGRSGAERVARLIGHARVVCLPAEVGDGGDVTDFFVRLKKSQEDFACLLKAAEPLAPETQTRLGDSYPAPKAAMTNSEAQYLKSLTPIQHVIGRYVDLHPRGKNHTGRCPFHIDRTPSFVVYSESGTFHCFGCRAHGDALSFLMRIEHLSFPKALRMLRELAEQHE